MENIDNIENQNNPTAQVDWAKAESQVKAETAKEVQERLKRLGDESMTKVNKKSRFPFTLKMITGYDSKKPSDSSEANKETADAPEAKPSNKIESAAFDEMANLMQKNVTDAVEKVFNLETRESDLKLAKKLAVEDIRANNPNILFPRNEATDMIEGELREVKNGLATIPDETPESYVVSKGLELRRRGEELRDGKLAKVDYTAKKIDQIKEDMEMGRPSLVLGDLGGGKTEMVITAAKEFAMESAAYEDACNEQAKMLEKNPGLGEDAPLFQKTLGRTYRKNLKRYENALRSGDPSAVRKFTPLFVSGSRDIETSDLFTDKTLTLATFDGKDLLKHKAELDKEFAEWERYNPEKASDPEERKNAQLQLLELYKMKNSAFGTVVEKIDNAVVKGMKEGRPVIIDEVNAIPSSVLISLNDVLTKRPGDVVTLPGEDEPIEIQPGFSIVMTGNYTTHNIEYFGTNEMNPAFLSRPDVVQYDYLPEDELFEAVMAYLVDRQGNLKIADPEVTIDKIHSLCKLAKAHQLTFQGKWKESNVTLTNDSGREVEPVLKTSVLSIRNIMTVLEKWNGGEKTSLDRALWDSFIESMPDADDQSFTIMLALHYGFFPKDEGWDVKVKAVGASRTTLDEVLPNGSNYTPGSLEVLDLRRVVEAIYGPAPARDRFPDIDLSKLEDEVDDNVETEDTEEAEAKVEEMNNAIEALNRLGIKCGCDNTVQQEQTSGGQ